MPEQVFVAVDLGKDLHSDGFAPLVTSEWPVFALLVRLRSSFPRQDLAGCNDGWATLLRLLEADPLEAGPKDPTLPAAEVLL